MEMISDLLDHSDTHRALDLDGIHLRDLDTREDPVDWMLTM